MRALVLALLACGSAVPTYAQSTAAPDLSGFRTFATWPDDAQVSVPGQATVSLSLSSWRWAFGHGMGLPGVFIGMGAAPHVQVSATLERDTSDYTDGTTLTTFGDTYVVAKVALVDPGTHRIGFAVSPLLQVLGDDSLTYYRYYQSTNTSRVQWALPVHVQVPVGRVQLSVSGGYFSVGSSFVAGMVEASVNSHLSVNGTISQAYSHNTSALADTVVAVSRHRSDVSGGLSLIATPSVFVFGSVGRTISATNQNSMTLSANLGIALILGKK